MGTNLGDLLKGAGLKASEASEVEGTERPTEPDADSGPAFAAKVHVRFTRKGRGGKTVTLVSGVLHRDRLVRLLRRELGLGARLDGHDLVINGNQVERVARWLESQGAARVVR